MTRDRPAAPHLLSLCTILRWFDHELLLALAAGDADEIASLLASDLVTLAQEPAGAYCLDAAVRADVLTRLHAEQPLAAPALHTRALDYFLDQMRQSAPAARRMAGEEACLYHFGELFFVLLARKDWPTLTHYIAAIRAADPHHAPHRQRLVLYEGYLAVRTQDFDRGEAILRTLLHQPDLETYIRIHALNALAQARWYQTHYDESLDLYRQLLTVARETGNRLYHGVALINMSLVYNDLEYYVQALDLSLQSLDIFRELGDRPREADALYAVGNNAMKLGRWQMAQRHFQEALGLYEALGNVGRLANIYWCQGFLHHMLGDEAQSERAYRRALEIAQSSEHGDLAVALDACSQLGLLYQTQERWDAALGAYDQAVELAVRLRNQHWLGLLHYRRGNVFRRQGRIDETLAAYRQAITDVEDLRGAIAGEEIKIGLLGTTQQLYESMVLLCLECEQPAEAFAYAERARSRAFLDTLARKSPELYDAVDQPVATLAEVQAHLPADALLLEYFTTGVLPRDEHLLAHLPPENTRLREHLVLPPQVLIFALTHDRFEVHRAQIDPNALRPQPSDPGPGRRLLRDRQLAYLHERLIGPVAHLLEAQRLLYLIPHGPLHYVPFMALRSAAGAYLLDAHGPMVALAPSATILLHNCLGRPPSRAEGCLALGYNDEGNEALRYAEAEARHVAQLMGGEAWTGAAPKSARLIAEGRRARWLHVAGHAVYNPRDPLGSELRLGPDDALNARAIIGGLELDAELVTLSACTSGLSHVVPGDELLGLQRAFLYAGAPAVVCTLWEAADLVALLVMDRFYADVRAGQSAAAALRDAQVAVRAMTGRELLATLERWRAADPALVAALGELPVVAPEQLDAAIYADPFYWAPFMLIGRP